MPHEIRGVKFPSGGHVPGMWQRQCQEPAGSRVAATVQSSTDRAIVRAQAADAVRMGQIPRGEASYM